MSSLIRVEEKREKAAQRVFSHLLNDLLLLGIVACYLGKPSADYPCKDESFVRDLLIGLLVGMASLVLLILQCLKSKEKGHF